MSTKKQQAPEQDTPKGPEQQTPEQGASEQDTPAIPEKTVHYVVDHDGATTDKYGVRRRYRRGHVLELPDGALDHLGGAKKLTAKEVKELTEGK